MTFKSNLGDFRSQLSEDTFVNKYKHDGCETWPELARTLVYDVCGEFLVRDELEELVRLVAEMKFIPGGRYLYYAGRPKKFFNNCYLLRAEEDSREGWADLSWRAENCLLTGGGIGVEYSRVRPSGSIIKRTGGVASGPIAKMLMVNEIGRNVMQGGSRRSAIYASLNHKHGDINKFLTVKNWEQYKLPGGFTLKDAKEFDFNFPAPLDMTNISINYDTEWLMNYLSTGDYGNVFLENCKQALTTGEPGFSFNFFDKEEETLRNACTEVTSRDDSDVCNLGSVNLSRIESIRELSLACSLGTMFLLCGTMVADLPYEKIYKVREQNRRLGLGLMGIHEWLIEKGQRYEVTEELHNWLSVYEKASDRAAISGAARLGISRPIAVRAIAPTGTIGMIAGTTTGIEPIYAVAYKRRYLKNGTQWKWQTAVDFKAQQIIDKTGVDPDTIESSVDLAHDYERRIKFQAEVQRYVDQSISSTINLPRHGTINPTDFATTLAKYAKGLRGFTCYPDGARGGQPITAIGYKEAVEKLGQEFEENLETNDECAGGICGI